MPHRIPFTWDKEFRSLADHIGGFQRRMSFVAAVLGMFSPAVASLGAEVSGQAKITVEMGEQKRLSQEEAHDRGIKLRAELDKAFSALQGSAKAGHADEFTAIVHPYISAGTGLEDAEAILRAAGFAEPPHPHEEQDRNKDRYAVVAEIPQFSGRVFGNVEAYVMLLAPEQGLAEFAGRRHRLTYFPLP